MSDFPKERLQPDQPPFSNVGMDYFGPFQLKRGRSTVKRYGVTFTCMVLRAVHLEMAFSLDTDSCINAIRRFIARRGKPNLIRSDNGTNLAGAEKELREAIQAWNSDKIHNQLLQKGIQCESNPPSASHFGGFWERLIRSQEDVLYTMMEWYRQETKLSDNEIPDVSYVIDVWIQEEEKKEVQEDSSSKPFQRKKKKPLAERIAEREAAKVAKEEEEKKQNTPLTAEEELTEKLRREKIQKEADLKLAKEAFGIEVTGIDAMYPETEEEYNKFEEALKTKISFFEKSKYYVPFLEKLFTNLAVSLESEDVKRIGATLNTVFHEKQRQQKEQEKNSKKKGKKKIVIKAERDNDFGDLAAASTGEYNDYYDEDFI
ncbi:eukaryotic translation initiation factor 3 subunit J-A [Ostrea edulis]|uniref:eukaryotic translation initiation factor 3 subunit J-A n=1 Tax=Ostrea edulis TaxID=37623 RepID=UPI0024AFC26A|nr:eukaryotic translation initiation factor 3 subunit J-A [Ostrea edulis]